MGDVGGQQGQIDVKKEDGENVRGKGEGEKEGESGVAMDAEELHNEGQPSTCPLVNTTTETSTDTPSHPKSTALFRVSVIMDPTQSYDVSTGEMVGASRVIHGVREDSLLLIGKCTGSNSGVLYCIVFY